MILPLFQNFTAVRGTVPKVFELIWGLLVEVKAEDALFEEGGGAGGST